MSNLRIVSNEEAWKEKEENSKRDSENGPIARQVIYIPMYSSSEL